MGVITKSQKIQPLLHDVFGPQHARRVAREISLSLQDGVVIQGAEGRILWHNSVACRLLQMSSEELLSTGSADPRWQSIRLDGSDYPGPEHATIRTLETGRTIKNDVMGVRVGDLSLKWLRFNSTPLELDGETFVMSTFADITDELEHRRALTATLQEIQNRLIQRNLPADDRIRFVGSYRSIGISNSVGGDFYGAYRHADDRMSFFIGDVCGHGIRSAGLSSLARTTVRALAPVLSDPDAVISHLHDIVKAERPDTFLTALFGTLRHDDHTTTLSIVSGGHPLPMLIRDGVVHHLGHSGQLIGMLPNSPRPVATYELRRGDQVVTYTDGVIDAVVPRLTDTEFAERIPTNASLEHVVDVLRRMGDSMRGDASDDAAVLAFEVV